MTSITTQAWIRPLQAAKPDHWSWDPLSAQAAQDSRSTACAVVSSWRDLVDVPPARASSRGQAPTAPQPPAADQPTTPDHWQMAAAQLSRVLAEALDGQRRLAQVEALFDPQSVVTVERRRQGWSRTSVKLASVRAQPTGPHRCEVTARLVTPTASHAMAFRVENRDGRWRGRDLMIG
ncbi:MAG: Rv3235 family protein [Propionibacteriaceae bacterium]|nr:Rv3235 family protein [Propionibacteriaceae bacterium]